MRTRQPVTNISFARVAQWIECFPPKEEKNHIRTYQSLIKSGHSLSNGMT